MSFLLYRRTKNEKFNIMDKLEFKFLSFELDPNAPKESKINLVESMAKKYHMPVEQSRKSIEYINKLGKAEGLDFRNDTSRLGNTFNAHRLTKYIESKGNYENTEKIINLLYDAYFTKNLLISDEKVLIDLGIQAGCTAIISYYFIYYNFIKRNTKEEVEKLLASNEFTKEVRQDEEAGYSEGVHGVPYFIINNEVIDGAVPKEEMKEVLLRVLKNEEKKGKDGHPKGVVCNETGCHFKKK